MLNTWWLRWDPGCHPSQTFYSILLDKWIIFLSQRCDLHSRSPEPNMEGFLPGQTLSILGRFSIVHGRFYILCKLVDGLYRSRVCFILGRPWDSNIVWIWEQRLPRTSSSKRCIWVPYWTVFLPRIRGMAQGLSKASYLVLGVRGF